VIIHSRRTDGFAALVQEYRDVPVKARYPSEKLEWLNLPEIRSKADDGYLWPGMAIYLSEEVNNLVIVSDAGRTARPDLLIDILYAAKGENTAEIGHIIRRAEAFRPRLGSLIISAEQASLPAPALAFLSGGEEAENANNNISCDFPTELPCKMQR